MEETVATIFVLVVLGTTSFFVLYLIGSLACALAGVKVGHLTRIGVGMLGAFAVSLGAAYHGVEAPPAWVFWIGAIVCAAGLVYLLRLARRQRAAR